MSNTYNKVRETLTSSAEYDQLGSLYDASGLWNAWKRIPTLCGRDLDASDGYDTVDYANESTVVARQLKFYQNPRGRIQFAASLPAWATSQNALADLPVETFETDVPIGDPVTLRPEELINTKKYTPQSSGAPLMASFYHAFEDSFDDQMGKYRGDDVSQVYGESESRETCFLQIMVSDVSPTLLSKFGTVEKVEADIAVFDTVKKIRITPWQRFALQHAGNDGYICSLSIEVPKEVAHESGRLTAIMSLSKLLVGTDSLAVDLYSRAAKAKEADFERLRSIHRTLTRDGKNKWHKQPFCWTFFGLKQGMHSADAWSLFRENWDMSDARFLDEMLLISMNTMSESPQLQYVPVTSTVFVEVSPHQSNPNSIDVPVFPTAYGPWRSWQKVCHDVYVSPVSLNLLGWDQKGNARNIVVSVTLRWDDDVFPVGDDDEFTMCSYHQRTPEFHQEFLRRLPASLNQKHHFLFRFYHLNCKPESGMLQDRERMTYIGCSVLTLIDSKGNIVSGVQELPFITSGIQPRQYLSQESLSRAKFLDGTRPCFRVRIEPLSSLYPSNVQVRALLNGVSSQLSTEGPAFSLAQSVQFFPSVADALLFPTPTSKNVETLLHLAEKLPVFCLKDYVRLWFDHPNLDERFLPALVQSFSRAFENVAISKPDFLMSLPERVFSFALDLLTKTCVLTSLKFGVVCWDALCVDVPNICAIMCRNDDSARNIARFILAVQHLTMDYVDSFVTLLDKTIESFPSPSLVATFIRQYMQTPWLLTLTLPRASVTFEHSSSHFADFFVLGCLLRHACRLLMSTNIAEKKLAVEMVMQLMLLCDNDSRFNSADIAAQQRRNAVSYVYMPLCSVLLSGWDGVSSLAEASFLSRSAMCFLWVCKWTDVSCLHDFIVHERNNLESLFSVLKKIVVSVEYVPSTGMFRKHKIPAAIVEEVSRLQWKTVSCEADEAFRDCARRHVSASAALTVISLLAEVFAPHMSEVDTLASLRTQMLSGASSTIISLLVTNQATQVIVELGHFLRFILYRMQLGRFSMGYRFAEELMTGLLLRFTSSHESVRIVAAACCYALCKQQYANFGSLYGTLTQLTWSLSKIIPSVRMDDDLLASLSFVAHLAQVDVDKNPSFFAEVVNSKKSQFRGITITSPDAADGNAAQSSNTLAPAIYVEEPGVSSHAVPSAPPLVGSKRRSVALDTRSPTSDVPVLWHLFPRALDEVIVKVKLIASNSLKVHASISNKATVPSEVEAIFVQTIDSFDHAPDQLAVWLDNLSYFHLEQMAFSEAAQCMLSVCRMIAEFVLAKTRTMRQGSSAEARVSTFEYIIRSLKSMLPAWDRKKDHRSWIDVAIKRPESLCMIATFQNAPSSMLPLLQRAALFFEKDSLLEYSSLCLQISTLVYSDVKDFGSCGPIYTQMSTLSSDIAVANQKQNRVFGTYYRVTFADGVQDGERKMVGDYIYKQPKITRVGEFKAMLESQFPAFSVLPTRMEKALPTVPEEEKAIFITLIQPMSSSDAEDATHFDRNVAISRFSFEVPFTKNADGTVDFSKPYSTDFSQQWKRRVILRVDDSFPSIRTRINVESVKEEIIDPLQNSVELVRSRIENLRSVCAHEPPDINQLQLALQGSVMAAVNGGIPEIVRAFLVDRNQFASDRLAELEDELLVFLDRCERSLELATQYVKDENRGLHNVLQEKFLELRAYVNNHVQSGEKTENSSA